MPRIELLGLARHYAGADSVHCSGATLGDALRDLGRQCPEFAARCPAGEILPPGLIACLNERKFSREAGLRVVETDRILILSADVGGN